MANNSISSIFLPDEAKAVIWRIFGEGESPLKGRSTYELIEPIIRNFVVFPIDQDRAITEICGWFESHGDRQWLKSDMSEPVAELIVEGIGTERSETAIWAIGSVEVGLAAGIIHSRWSSQEINSLVKAALTTLKKLCDRDEVLDATRCTGFAAQDSIKAKIPKDAVKCKGRLETFQHLDNHGFELVHRGIYPAAGNLIELVIKLRPEQFELLIEKLDHLVMQARAADCMIDAALSLNHRTTLEWITKDSCDALVSLAIVHTLNTVNKLDEDFRYAGHMSVDQYRWTTELRLPQDDLDSAADALLNDLVDRLAVLDPLACARWIGELLSDAPYGLHQHGGHEKPLRIEQLERACIELLARLACQSWSDNLLAELRAGLCLTPRMTWTRHIADVAWEIREDEPARAAEIAQVTLDLHDQHIAEQLEQNRLFLDWSDWHQREWFSSLGIALVLSHEYLDLPEWVSAQCQKLSLSVWDAEENYEAFISADRAVQHRFLVALHAIPVLNELGRTIDPAAVRTLAETLWDHCHFAGQYLPSYPAALVTSELAARFTAEFGEPNDAWLLDRARHLGVGPLALWALIDQRRLKDTHEGGTDTHYDKMIIRELVRVASDRFGGGGQFDLEALRFWGQLWLLLYAINRAEQTAIAINEAEQTAIAICAFPLREHDRVYKILVLKLFALVASERKLPPEIEDYVASLYRQLWSGYTASEELEDREQTDEMLKRSESPIL